jgi:hypothetical protein
MVENVDGETQTSQPARQNRRCLDTTLGLVRLGLAHIVGPIRLRAWFPLEHSDASSCSVSLESRENSISCHQHIEMAVETTTTTSRAEVELFIHVELPRNESKWQDVPTLTASTASTTTITMPTTIPTTEIAQAERTGKTLRRESLATTIRYCYDRSLDASSSIDRHRKKIQGPSCLWKRI